MSSMHCCARNFGSVNSACVFPGDAKLQEFEDEHPELLESPWKDPPFFHLQVQVSQYKIGSVQMPWDHSSLGIAFCQWVHQEQAEHWQASKRSPCNCCWAP
jgi:hypothetical protein